MNNQRSIRPRAGFRVFAAALVALAVVALVTLMSGGRAQGGPLDVATIYNNTDSLGESVRIPEIPIVSPQDPQRIVDWSISPGGTVTSFEIAYTSSQPGPISIDVTFFDGANQQTDGFPIVTIDLHNLPGSQNPPEEQELGVVIDISDTPFELPEGPFGYGFDLYDDDTGIVFAEGDPFGVDLYRAVPQNINVNTPGVHDQLFMGINGELPLILGGTVAYVSNTATGPGALNDPTMPYSSMTLAMAAGASELRIKPGVYEGDFFGGGTTLTRFRTWNGEAGDSLQIDILGNVEINGNLTIVGELEFGIGFNVSITGDFVNDGEVTTNGGDVTVLGDYNHGPGDQGEAGDSLFSLDFDGEHTVVGDFTVAPDADPDSQDPVDRNRYFLKDGVLNLTGDYFFEGTGDVFDSGTPAALHGLRGAVSFLGDQQQDIFHRQDEDAFFADVIMNGAGDNRLLADAWQNQEGTLTLEHGIIDTNDDQFDWVILNPGIETDLVGRNNSAKGKGVVQLGSRDSYIDGPADRAIAFGTTTGSVVTGGYLFPVGAASDTDLGEPTDVDFFRPLILQFPDDLGAASFARVDYRQDLTNDDVEFPDDGMLVPDVGGGDINLDVIGNQFWQLEFDQIPSVDPNIRVEADGLPNIFDMKSLRLIQWDCDGTNPRLGGVFTLGDDESAVITDFINGVPNITHVDVDVNECNLFGIASVSEDNQIDQPPPKQHTQGDIDCDDDIDAVDGLQLLLNAAGIEYHQEGDCITIGGPLNPPQQRIAQPSGAPPDIFGDVDCDGDTDAVDALKILQFVAAIPFTQSDPCTDIGDPF